jgi:predicted small lipoprotein YifL
MHRGYIKIWRKIKDSGLYQLPETLALFLHLLTEATHQTRRVGTVKLERGQYMSGRIQLAAELQQTERKIRTGLERLQELEIITVEASSRFSIYTIVNYNNYQDFDQQSTSDRPASDQQATSDRPASDQQATTKQEHKHITHNTEGIKKETCAFVLPDWIDKTQWDLWMKTRKGKKMIPEQMQKQVEKLKGWRDEGKDHCGALANSALNGWTGLFLPDSAKNGTRLTAQQQRDENNRKSSQDFINGNISIPGMGRVIEHE